MSRPFWPVLVLVPVLVAACGGAPPVVQVDPRPQRRFEITLDPEHGDLSALVDGREVLHAGVNGRTNLALGLRAGEHTLLLRGHANEYGGMGVIAQVAAEGDRIIDVRCSVPCDDKGLAAWIATAKADLARLSDPCSGVTVRDVTGESTKGGDVEIRVQLALGSPLSRSERTARGCR